MAVANYICQVTITNYALRTIYIYIAQVPRRLLRNKVRALARQAVAVAADEVAQVVALPRACWRVPMQWRCPRAPPGDSLQVAAVAVAADELAQVLALLRSCCSVPTQWSCPKSPPHSWKTSPAASWGAGFYQPSQLKLLKRFFSQSVCCRASKQPGKTPGSRTLPLVSSLGGPTSGDP